MASKAKGQMALTVAKRGQEYLIEQGKLTVLEGSMIKGREGELNGVWYKVKGCWKGKELKDQKALCTVAKTAKMS